MGFCEDLHVELAIFRDQINWMRERLRNKPVPIMEMVVGQGSVGHQKAGEIAKKREKKTLMVPKNTEICMMAALSCIEATRAMFGTSLVNF